MVRDDNPAEIERDWTGVYAIVDDDAWRRVGVDLQAPGVVEAITEALTSIAPVALQLRAKHLAATPTLALLKRLAPIARAAGTPVYANDRADLALLAFESGVVGVHVGQDDLPAHAVAEMAPKLRIGVSTHARDQLDAALAQARRGVDYVAIGPVFATRSKDAPDATLGEATVADFAMRARRAGVPLVAIGGISRANIADVARAGVRCAAVISELVVVDRNGRPALDEVCARGRALGDVLRRARG